MTPERRREIIEEEQLRRQLARPRAKSPTPLISLFSTALIIVGLVGSLYYATQPNLSASGTPGWPWVLMLAGFAIFVINRILP